jgi:predicted esterase
MSPAPNPSTGSLLSRVATAGVPLDRARAVVVLTHGRNAGPENILELAPQLDRANVAYLAPAAPGRTWYPQSFMAETAANEPSLSASLKVLPTLVDEIVRAGVPRDRIVLMGFSQGACLTAESVVRHATRYGGVALFTGGLIGPPGTSWDYPGSFESTPIFLGTSDVDAHVPLARVKESAEVFSRMHAEVTLRVYPGMPHTVNDDEIDAARDILDRVLRRA